MAYFVYVMTNRRDGTLYIGVTNDLARRAFEHRERLLKGFTRRYNLDRLVYYETYPTAYEAIQREKSMKKWNRAWKVALIEQANPAWRDLHDELNA